MARYAASTLFRAPSRTVLRPVKSIVADVDRLLCGCCRPSCCLRAGWRPSRGDSVARLARLPSGWRATEPEATRSRLAWLPSGCGRPSLQVTGVARLARLPSGWRATQPQGDSGRAAGPRSAPAPRPARSVTTAADRRPPPVEIARPPGRRIRAPRSHQFGQNALFVRRAAPAAAGHRREERHRQDHHREERPGGACCREGNCRGGTGPDCRTPRCRRRASEVISTAATAMAITPGSSTAPLCRSS